MSLVLGVPAAIVKLAQEGLLERGFHDSLYPALQYRSEALVEEWPANTGEEIFMSRAGLLVPRTKPLIPGVDLTPQTASYEQWVARLCRFGDAIDTHMPTSATSNANQFLRNIQTIGLQAGQSLNRVPRNELFKAYLSGHTATTVAAAAIDTTIQVASVNGFTDVVIPASTVRPAPVSPATPLPITITGIAGTRNVIGFTLDDPNNPTGPGSLVLDAALGGAIPARTAVLSSARPDIIRVGGGDSIDAIGAGDLFTLQSAITACNRLRRHNVQPHEDNFYHAHISPDSNTQVFADPAFQRLNTALPDHTYYRHGFIGTIGGIAFFMNTESPDTFNTGAQVSTGVAAQHGEEIGAETVNEGGISVGRILVTGRGSLYERWLDEEKHFVTEAGMTGKVGEFSITNAGLTVTTERIRLVIRAPIDRLQDVVSAAWSISTAFPVPSDVTATSGPQRFKRAIVIEHALG
jgi:hypothetical protein